MKTVLLRIIGRTNSDVWYNYEQGNIIEFIEEDKYFKTNDEQLIRKFKIRYPRNPMIVGGLFLPKNEYHVYEIVEETPNFTKELDKILDI